jgi:hypothetical protein
MHIERPHVDAGIAQSLTYGSNPRHRDHTMREVAVIAHMNESVKYAFGSSETETGD